MLQIESRHTVELIGVFITLHLSMLNLFRSSLQYFESFMNILFVVGLICNPRK